MELSENFTHLIITRFNLRKDDWHATKNKDAVLTERWLTNRFQLFEKYCFPSLVNQRNRNFKWLIYFDITTPPEFVTKIKAFSEGGRTFQPVFVDGMDAFLPSINGYIQSLNTPYVITSRVDNDDCLHENYVDEVQRLFNCQDYMAIDFIDGYALQLVPFVRIGFKRWASNPFITLIEKREDAVSVWYRSHTEWKREKKIIVVENIRVWLQVVHYENKVNEFTAYGNVALKPLLKKMHIEQRECERLVRSVHEVSSWRLFSWWSRIDVFTTYYWQQFKKKIGYYRLKT